MVKRGLKVGDTFEDGGLEYTVLHVNKDGSYVSTLSKNVKQSGHLTKDNKETPGQLDDTTACDEKAKESGNTSDGTINAPDGEKSEEKPVEASGDVSKTVAEQAAKSSNKNTKKSTKNSVRKTQK